MSESRPPPRNVHFDFVSPGPDHDRIRLYVQELFEFHLDHAASKGFLEFNGYLYANVPGDPAEICEWDPTQPPRKKYGTDVSRALMYFWETDTEGKPHPEKPGVTTYAYIDEGLLLIEFTRREIINNTDSYGPVQDDDDGDEMNICFFPTDHQRLHFKILQKIEKSDPLPEDFQPATAAS